MVRDVCVAVKLVSVPVDNVVTVVVTVVEDEMLEAEVVVAEFVVVAVVDVPVSVVIEVDVAVLKLVCVSVVEDVVALVDVLVLVREELEVVEIDVPV